MDRLAKGRNRVPHGAAGHGLHQSSHKAALSSAINDILHAPVIFATLESKATMRKTLLLLFIALLGSPTWAQKALTLSDAVLKAYSEFTPERVKGLQWIEGTAAYSYVKDGSLMIKGNNSKDFICIPSYIDGFAEIHQRLQQVRPIDVNNKLPFWLKYQILLSVLTMGLMVVVFVVNIKWVVALSGSIFIALMTWSLIEIRGNKNVDTKTKRSAWWVIVVMLAVIVGMIMKLNV